MAIQLERENTKKHSFHEQIVETNPDEVFKFECFCRWINAHESSEKKKILNRLEANHSESYMKKVRSGIQEQKDNYWKNEPEKYYRPSF